MKMTSVLLIGAFALANGTLWAGTGHQDSIDRLQMSSEVFTPAWTHRIRAFQKKC